MKEERRKKEMVKLEKKENRTKERKDSETEREKYGKGGKE